MTMMELLLYLRVCGDSVAWRADGKLMTRFGHKYIESYEGMEYYNGTWTRKTIWARA